MRELLFRGKRIDNGEWVDGYLGQDTIIGNGKSWLGYVINPVPKKVWDSDFFEVDPSTVGQYTGLKDKNGKRIFEGDIVRLPELYGNGKAVIRFYGAAFRACGGAFSYHVSESMKAIGNIHDNPELMDGGEAE